jgi:hypothetical protein
VSLELAKRERWTRGYVSIVGLNLHMHRGVVANSVGDAELTAALLLPHELEHVHVARAD